VNHEDTRTRSYGLDDETEVVARDIVQAAFAVHFALGPGLLESVYEVCLAHELHQRGVAFEQQLGLPVTYGRLRLDAGLRLDFLVAKRVIVEVKAVEALLPVHRAQVLTYLKLSGHHLGFLIHFNVPLIKEGLKRVVL